MPVDIFALPSMTQPTHQLAWEVPYHEEGSFFDPFLDPVIW
jgi:hypothetical protein